MQPTTQLYIVLIGLVFFIAPFSRAGSNRQKLRLPSKPLFPFKGDETGFYAFDKTYGSISNLTSDKAKRETQEKNEYRAVLSHDKVWRIKVTGPDYDQTKLQRFEAYWSGEINVSGRLLGSGGQGKVTEVRFQNCYFAIMTTLTRRNIYTGNISPVRRHLPRHRL